MNRGWLLAWCGLVLGLWTAAPVHALRIYFIGNSVTDTVNYNGFKSLAESRGFTQPWGRHMIPGAPLQWIWDHPNDGFNEAPYGHYGTALPNYQWDVLSLQPFDRSLESDVDYATRYINLAKPRSPNLQVYIYARWPRTSVGDFDAHWTSPYTGSGLSNETADFFEDLTVALRNANLGIPPVLMVPVGHVMYEMNQRMKRGEVPGFNNIYQFYADGIHLTGNGSYLVGCTYFATLYKQNPAGLPTTGYSGVTSGLVPIIHDAVWDIVSTHPLAGVAGATFAITTSALPSGTQNTPYSASLQASGGQTPITWSVASGSLPAGISLSSGGTLSGTPTASGSFNVTIRATASNGQTATKAFTLSVQADSAPTITTSSLPAGSRGTPYNVQLAATGGNGNLTWSVASGALPVGVALQGNGQIVGTPGVEGSFNVTVRVTDSDATNPDSATRALTLSVGAPDNRTLLIKKVTTPISVDGALDETVWTLATSASKAKIGTPNNTVTFGALWDSSYLYVAVRVLDGTVLNDSANNWDDDAVQVLIDSRHDREIVFNNDDRQFIIQAADGNLFEQGGRTTGVLRGVAAVAGGYTVELAIPWSNLGRTPFDNMAIGFDVGNDDDDNNGARDAAQVWWDANPANPTPNQFGNLLMTPETVSGPVPSPTPYGGTAWAIPGTIEAENFDNGGQGVGFSDTDPANNGGQYRTTGVDIEATTDAGGGFNVGWVRSGEWLGYSVNVAQGGSHSVRLRVAAATAVGAVAGQCHLEANGVNLTGPINVPGTGGWQNWTDVTATIANLPAGAQQIRLVMDADNFNVNKLTFTSTSTGTLPAPWQGQDIGSVGVAGNASYASPTFTVRGSGADIWANADAFRFVYQAGSGGDVEIRARVTAIGDTDPWAKVGVMIRQDLTPGSPHAFMALTRGNGVAFQNRPTAGGSSAHVSAGTGTAPVWVRLVRSGTTVTGFRSADGTSWTQVGSVNLTGLGNGYIGLAVTAHNNGVLNTATFDGVSVQPLGSTTGGGTTTSGATTGGGTTGGGTTGGGAATFYTGESGGPNLASGLHWAYPANRAAGNGVTVTESAAGAQSGAAGLVLDGAWDFGVSGTYGFSVGYNWTAWGASTVSPIAVNPASNSLRVWIKANRAYPADRLRLRLRDAADRQTTELAVTSAHVAGGLTTGWKQLVVPLSEFGVPAGFDWSQLVEFDLTVLAEVWNQNGSVIISLDNGTFQ